MIHDIPKGKYSQATLSILEGGHNLYLRRPTLDDESEYLRMMLEWEQDGSLIHPGLLRRRGLLYTEWLADIEAQRHEATCREDRGPSELYLLCDDTGYLYGAGSTRFREPVASEIGHVAYGIRPAERGKGYGKKQLHLLAQRCLEAGLSEIRVNCRQDNLASRATILSCGGIYVETTLDDEGRWQERYSIALVKGGG